MARQPSSLPEKSTTSNVRPYDQGLSEYEQWKRQVSRRFGESYVREYDSRRDEGTVDVQQKLSEARREAKWLVDKAIEVINIIQVRLDKNDDNREQDIGSSPYSPLDFSSVNERLKSLDRFVEANPGMPVSELVKQLFPEILEKSSPSPVVAAVVHGEQVGAAGSRPLPDGEDLRNRGLLYSQVFRSRPETDIIQHLRSNVWWDFISTGRLTRPELLKRDPSAYHALYRWASKPGHNLVAALDGHDIPTRSQVVRANLTPEAIREARRVSSLAYSRKK